MKFGETKKYPNTQIDDEENNVKDLNVSSSATNALENCLTVEDVEATSEEETGQNDNNFTLIFSSS